MLIPLVEMLKYMLTYEVNHVLNLDCLLTYQEYWTHYSQASQASPDQLNESVVNVNVKLIKVNSRHVFTFY